MWNIRIKQLITDNDVDHSKCSLNVNCTYYTNTIYASWFLEGRLDFLSVPNVKLLGALKSLFYQIFKNASKFVAYRCYIY